MGEGRTPAQTRLGRFAERAMTGFVAVSLVILACGALYALGDAVLAPTPVAESPGFVDTVLASRAVVAAIRLAIIFAAAFVVVSAIALIWRRQWPTRIGPVEISEKVSDIDAENERLKTSLENARDTIDNLMQDLAQTNYLLDQLRDSGEAE